MRLLHPPGLICSRRQRWRDHQAQALKQHYRTLRRATPDELATLTLAVLYVDVAAGVLQAAILEGTVDEDPLVKNQVLVLEELIFVSSHQRTRLPLPCSCRKLTVNVIRRYLRSIHQRSDEAPEKRLPLCPRPFLARSPAPVPRGGMGLGRGAMKRERRGSLPAPPTYRQFARSHGETRRTRNARRHLFRRMKHRLDVSLEPLQGFRVKL